MKKKYLAIALSLICIAAIAGISMASKVVSDVAKSRINASNVKVELVMTEEDDQGNKVAVSGDTTFTPGQTKSRTATVKNIGDQPAWVRVKAELVMPNETFDAVGTPYSDLEGMDDGTNWTRKDGFWYYNKILEPGQTTEPVFTGISFRADSIDEDNGKNMNLKVDAQGTQSKNNGSSATEAAGWPKE